MDTQTKQAFIDGIYGDNKDRDFRIIYYHCMNPQRTCLEIVADQALDMSDERVRQILANNEDLVLKLFAKVNPLYFKEGRARELVKEFNAKDLSRRDKLDILDALRKEIEGDNKTSIGVIIQSGGKDGEPELRRNDIELQKRIQEDLEKNRLL